jgi:signal transduction histidine kinase
VRFARELGPALPDVEADPVQMRQIVVNLVVNAIQAIRGAGRITVRTRALADAVELEVEDSGGGMTPEVAARAFDPFFTTKDVGEGTGLGLSVVQGIITAHGGTIALDTAPGRGSRFTVRVPLNSAAAA